MPLFRQLTDDEEIERMERKTQNKMNKLFDKMDGWDTFPGESTILREDNIYAKDFERLTQETGRINIDYKYDMGFFVKDKIRVRIDVYHIGSILCTGIKSIREMHQIKKSSIEVSFFLKNKKIQFPIQNISSLEIECKKLIIEKFQRYGMHDNKLIPLNDKLEMLRNQL
jgi:hypothetical protein